MPRTFIEKTKYTAFILVSCVLFSALSVGISSRYYATDFPLYYYVASTILDENAPRNAVYAIDYDNKYNIPEIRPFYLNFMYSIPAAYILSPLAFMSYYTAKAVMICLNIFLYLGGVFIALRLVDDSCQGLIYPFILSVIWMPFIHTLAAGQINGLLFFLVAASVFAATKNRPALCGALLGVASLFKLFPVVIAMVLGLKNWRILVACVLVVTASFIIPGSLEWFSAIGNIYLGPYKAKSLWLRNIGVVGYVCYAFAVAIITAFLVFRSRHKSYPLISSFAIPATFLAMPNFLFYHLTLLILPLLYLWKTSGDIVKLIIVSIILLIFIFYMLNHHNYAFPIVLLLFTVWTILARQLILDDT